MDNNYIKYLLNILDNTNNINKSLELDINIYLTLLNLNHNYSNDYYMKELQIIEDYLRKLNNLKVKIQLKRKDTEIDKLKEELLSIYEENKTIIDKYNKNNLDTVSIINEKEPTELTKLIDSETKEKIIHVNNKSKNDELRNKLIYLLPASRYEIKNNVLYLFNDIENIEISLDEFYLIFDYLLNIDTYPQPLLNNKNNRNHTIMVANIIKLLIGDIVNSNTLIPVILSYIMTREDIDINEIDMSKFKIDNIKISDLYSFSKEETNIDKTTKWRKINIPNEYLFNKIKDSILNGTYYFNEDRFILENIDNSVSDFKTSISFEDINIFLKDILNELTNRVTITK